MVGIGVGGGSRRSGEEEAVGRALRPGPGQVGHVPPQSRQVVDSITVLPADRQGLTEV